MNTLLKSCFGALPALTLLAAACSDAGPAEVTMNPSPTAQAGMTTVLPNVPATGGTATNVVTGMGGAQGTVVPGSAGMPTAQGGAPVVAQGGMAAAQGGAPMAQGGTLAAQGGMPAVQGGSGMGGAPAQTADGIPAGYTLQLDEPFATMAALDQLNAGNGDAWAFQTADGGSLEWSGFGYTPPAVVGESLSSFALVSNLRFGSFVLDVELLQLNPDTTLPHRDLAIVFNAQSETQYYWAHIAQTHDDRSHNIHMVNGGPRTPITLTDNGGIMWGTDQWHPVRIVRDATVGTIEVYWDGDLQTPILTASDTTFTEGYIGFGTFQDAGRARNLKVWAPSATLGTPETFFQ